MIKPVEMFMIECDNCGEDYVDSEGMCASVDTKAIEYFATESDWRKEGDKHYCPECHSIGDNDELVINERRKTHIQSQ